MRATDEEVQLVEVRQKQTLKIYQGPQGSNSSRPDLLIPTQTASSHEQPHRFKIPLHTHSIRIVRFCASRLFLSTSSFCAVTLKAAKTTPMKTDPNSSISFSSLPLEAASEGSSSSSAPLWHFVRDDNLSSAISFTLPPKSIIRLVPLAFDHYCRVIVKTFQCFRGKVFHVIENDPSHQVEKIIGNDDIVSVATTAEIVTLENDAKIPFAAYLDAPRTKSPAGTSHRRT